MKVSDNMLGALVAIALFAYLAIQDYDRTQVKIAEAKVAAAAASATGCK